MDATKRKAPTEVKVCAKRGKLCGDEECPTCFVRSLASSARVDEFKAANPDKDPLLIAISTKTKYDWKCACGHTFKSSCDNVQSGSWCPYCSKQKLCGAPSCIDCFGRSMASSSRVQAFKTANPGENVLLIAISKNKLYQWQCSCGHVFEATCNDVQSDKWCPYCSVPRKKLCVDPTCAGCLNGSMASSSRVVEFTSANPDKNPRLITISTGTVYDWACACGHTFKASCANVQNGRWCPFCCVPKQKLCGVLTCVECLTGSMASSARVEEFKAANPHENILIIPISSSRKKYDWLCSCGHTFQATCGNVQSGFWCPYCSKQRLCGIQACDACSSRSMAASVRAEEFKAANPDANLLLIAISCNKDYQWKCACGHMFEASCNTIQSGRWCPYCSGRICRRKECLTCAPPCDTCSKKSYHSLKNSSRACHECFVASGEARAKVRLEIFFLAELQRISREEVEFLEPTSWDCAVLPGLPYKPDMMWAFDMAGNLFNTTGACKLSLDHIKQIVILEVLEVGIEQHSNARTVSDAVRETEIRSSLRGVVVDFVYVVVAAYNHPSADASDKFFSLSKSTNSYSVVVSRKEAWAARVRQTLEALVNARKCQSGITVFIGS